MSTMKEEAPSDKRAELEADIERIKNRLRYVLIPQERQVLIDALVEAALALAKLADQ